ncbi:shikimate dehydrogenase [Candidatus Borrarchaeum sp.]|uniref:shikimate dehydrogenase n=1 Tax=Candidatus Borrarchaeum sp. TaxID=2846742 RepID=UPI00257B6DC3|nr:shikimate dehydrogenase [Candidatus Borrarchaeum sp.]
MITSETQLCGLIGHPVKHSLSPIMHNAAFKEVGIDDKYCYLAFNVLESDLKQVITAVKTLNIRGLNVTIPHKLAVMEYLDLIDTTAQSIGAVNTIVNNQGFLRGYNTDLLGVTNALKEAEFDPTNKKIVILGAGGAARAASFSIGRKAAELVIVNRSIEKANELCNDLLESVIVEARSRELSEKILREEVQNADLLVNCTSVGMWPDANQTLLKREIIPETITVFDTVYNPLETQLLKDAKKAGAKTISGLAMFVWQGAIAFELWTGAKAPIQKMKEIVSEKLKGGRNEK